MSSIKPYQLTNRSFLSHSSVFSGFSFVLYKVGLCGSGEEREVNRDNFFSLYRALKCDIIYEEYVALPSSTQHQTHCHLKLTLEVMNKQVYSLKSLWHRQINSIPFKMLHITWQDYIPNNVLMKIILFKSIFPLSNFHFLNIK